LAPDGTAAISLSSSTIPPPPDNSGIVATTPAVTPAAAKGAGPEYGSDEWYAQKIGSAIPDWAMPILSSANKYLIQPFNKMAATGAEAGKEAGSDVVSAATMLAHPDYLQATLPSPYGPKPPVQSPESLASEEHPIAKGVAEGVGSVAGSAIADPRNWPFFGSSAARPVLQKIISGGFGTLMGKDAITTAQDLHSNWDKYTPEQRAQLATQGGLSAAMAAAAGLHALSGETPEVSTAEATPATEATPKVSAGPTSLPPDGSEIVPGPGAQNLGTGVKESGSDITQLGAALRGPAPSVADRMNSALGDAPEAIKDTATAAVEGVKDAATTGLDRVKAAGGALWDSYSNPPEWTDFKDARGKWDYALQRSSHEAMQFAKDIKSGVDPLTREAFVNYIQAGGDDALLQQRAEASSGDLQKGYEAARDLTPDQTIQAQNLSNYFDAKLQQATDAGMLSAGIENYVNQIWDRPNPVTQKLQADVDYGTLRLNPSMLKKRVFDSYFDGEQAGFVPKNKDIGYLVTAYDESFNKALAGRAFVKSLLNGEGKDGRPLLVANADRASTIADADGSAKATLISPKFIGQEFADYKPIDHPALRKWTWIGKDSDGAPIFQNGDLWVHPDAYKELNNNLSKSQLRQIPAVRFVMNEGQKIKGSMLGYSFFHQVQEGYHAIGHAVNPFDVGKLIDFDEPKQRTLIEHGLQVSNAHAQQEFMDGHSEAYAYRVPVIGRIAQQYSDYLFHDFIPNLKMKTGLDILERNQKRFAGKFDADQIAEISAKQANAAFGELNYRQMGRNPTTQDVFRLLGLAPDFLEARGRFVAQALRPEGGEQRAALARLVVLTYGTARILNMAMNAGNPRTDKPFSVTFHGKDYALRGVVGDTAHLIGDPRSFIYTRLNPVTTKPLLEELTGRDEFGRTRTTAQHFWDTLKGWTPIAIQKWFKNPQDYSPIDSVLQSLGITSYPSRSDAGKAAQKYRAADDPANQEKAAQTKDLQSRVAAGKLSADQVRQMATQQEITQGQAKTITRPVDPVVTDFRRLPIEKAIDLWPMYTPEEQAKLAPELRKKAMSIGRLDRTSTQKQALTARVRAVLTGPTLQGSYNGQHNNAGGIP
jgi:hypothetical protein